MRVPPDEVRAGEVLAPPVWTVEVVTARATIEFDFDKRGDAERLANQLTSYPADAFMRCPSDKHAGAGTVWIRPSSVSAIRVYERA